MDDVDRKLIALLRSNARVTVAQLAKSLSVSRGTVQNRLRKLETDGTIVGYTVKLRPQAEGHHIRALMTVAVEGNRSEAVLRALAGDPAVALRDDLSMHQRLYLDPCNVTAEEAEIVADRIREVCDAARERGDGRKLSWEEEKRGRGRADAMGIGGKSDA